MNSKTLVIVAGGAIALAAVAAVVVMRSQEATAVKEYGQPVLPGLTQKVNDIATIEINSGGAISTVKKTGSAWVLQEKGNYPVKVEKVKEVLVGLAQLKELEPKTSKKDRYEEVGVQDPPLAPAPPKPPPAEGDAPEAPKPTPSLVTLKDASGAAVASVVVGQQRFGTPPSVFVRKAGDAQTWLASGEVQIPKEMTAWFDTQVINLPRDRMKKASVTQGKEGAVPLVVQREKKDDANFIVEGIPEGRALKAPGSGDATATALSYVNFDDVAPASSITPPEGVTPVTYRAETFDGMVVTAKITLRDGKYWATFDASVDEAALPKAPAPADPSKPADPAKPADPSKTTDPAAATPPATTPPAGDDAAKKADDVRKEVKAFNDAHGSWSYSIPEFKAKQFLTRVDELLAEPPPAKGPEGPPAGAPDGSGLPQGFPVVPPAQPK